MSADWKSGDAALIEVGCHANRHVGMYAGGGWHYRDNNSKWVSDDPAIVTIIRPLVVIDAEDREQVERLRDLMDTAWSEQTSDHGFVPIAQGKGQRGNALQAALRKFANPKPKPPEPTVGGSQVRESDGTVWTRVEGQPEKPWVYGCSDAAYSALDVVEAVR